MRQLQQQSGLEHPVRVYLPLDLLILVVSFLHAVFSVQLWVSPPVYVVEDLHGDQYVRHAGPHFVNVLQVFHYLLQFLVEARLTLRLKF